MAVASGFPEGLQDNHAPCWQRNTDRLSLLEVGSSVIVQCPEGKYYTSTKKPVSPDLIRFLQKNKGRRLKDILHADLEPSSSVTENASTVRSPGFHTRHGL